MRTCGRTDRRDEANSRFSAFCERPKIVVLNVTEFTNSCCFNLAHKFVISPYLAETNHWFRVTNPGVLVNASTNILMVFMSARYFLVYIDVRFICGKFNYNISA